MGIPLSLARTSARRRRSLSDRRTALDRGDHPAPHDPIRDQQAGKYVFRTRRLYERLLIQTVNYLSRPLGAVEGLVILVSVISKSDEQRILEQYESLLETEKARLREVQSGVDNLESIVHGLRERVGGDQAGTPHTATSPPAAVSPDMEPGMSIRHGRPTLSALVRQVMADGVARDAGAILSQLQERDALPAGDQPKQRQKIANRLVELQRTGYLERRERGVYVLASHETSENGAGREGPLLPVQPGVQKPPSEEVIAPRSGHPM